MTRRECWLTESRCGSGRRWGDETGEELPGRTRWGPQERRRRVNSDRGSGARLRRGNSGQVEKVREWVMRMRVLEVGGEGEREMVFDTAIREDEERETKREVVVMLVESGVEREAARAARYRITFACFCAARPAMPATHTHRALSLDRDEGG